MSTDQAGPLIAPNAEQRARDENGLRETCSACGGPEVTRDPLVIAADGYRVHVSHVITPGDGYYGAVFADEARPGRLALSSAAGAS